MNTVTARNAVRLASIASVKTFICSSKIVDDNCACIATKHWIIIITNNSNIVRWIDDAVVKLPFDISFFYNASYSAIYYNPVIQSNCYIWMVILYFNFRWRVFFLRTNYSKQTHS